MTRIELKRLSKSFHPHRGQPVPALLDLDLTVEPGEFMVLFGPSGSGKTTTLRLVAGLEEADSGSVLFDGALMDHRPAHERNVAMVFQRDALYPHMTVRENLSFGLRLRHEPNIDHRVREAAQRLGLEQLLERLPPELSGGQRQRVAVGRAIIRRPAAFLFDEPFTNLDAPQRAKLRRDLALLQRQSNTTTLYVTHDQADAMALGDRIAVLHQGRLQQVATPIDLYARPANAFVAGLFGSPPMNLLPATVSTDSRQVVLTTTPFNPAAIPFHLDIAQTRISSLKFATGRQVIIGVRPENVAITESAPQGPGIWTGTVEWVEWLGADMIVGLRVGGQLLLVRRRSSTPCGPGAIVPLWIDLSNTHFFDPATGEVIR